MSLTLKDLKYDLKMDLPSDRWGHAMGAFFDVAGEIYNRTAGAGVPERWQFSPGATDVAEVDEFWALVFSETDTETLLRFGYLLERYTDMLRRRGYSY
jgi:hypothetical protein